MPIPESRRAACDAAVAVCAAVRDAVAAVPLAQRVHRVPAALKPPPEVAAAPDVAGERAAIAVLARLAGEEGVEVRLVVDPVAGTWLSVSPPPGPNGGGGGGGSGDGGGAPRRQEGTQAGATAAQHAAGPAAPGDGAAPLCRYVYLDAVDGTLLLSGLQNEASAGTAPPRLRLAGAGGWAVGVALTDPTAAPLGELRLGDFTVAAIGDGAAAAVTTATAAKAGPLHPELAVAVWQEGDGGGGDNGGGGSGDSADGGGGGRYVTYDFSHSPLWRGGAAAVASGGGASQPSAPEPPRLHTTSCLRLGGTFAHLDAFQSRDAATAAPGAPRLACALFAALGDRGGGGAFDVLRAYGNLGALLRGFFGWRGLGGSSGDQGLNGGGGGGGGGGDESFWLEPQWGAFVCVNENLANMLPAVPLVLGAGGAATDLRGAPLAARRLVEGRASVAYAGNAALHAQLLALVAAATEGAGVEPL
ncbi:hypothetical protein Rsub_10431 [Raphidocelis subcapitata]|uniref:Uncharacterized protein n=1 Tax=Raphidocelis subcapitata TaxID=307507 RepID=A0A2V0PCD2_9CHLO|nr:hypothetical protein Rsub_10431 [Raphidocelis subcapitata]|eukprot:GBF97508.1 hypothetical protein Rsub_10431 [Raphidocelis subcapitata]